MKLAPGILAVCSLALTLALFLQIRAVRQLRAELAEARRDLKVALGKAELETSGPESNAGRARRDELELIRLRNEVRELKEGMAESHNDGPKAGLRDAARVLFAGTGGSGGSNVAPEWKGMEASLTKQYAEAMKGLNTTNDYERFLRLGRAAKLSLAMGHVEDARQFAKDSLVWDEKFSRGDAAKSNGDAVHDGNLVLGRIAVSEGQLDEARRHLLAAGKSNGSPVLGSFGPNTSLAKDLLLKGDQKTALEYFELCRKFWGMGGAKLDEWEKDIRAGRVPDFGGNLIY